MRRYPVVSLVLVLALAACRAASEASSAEEPAAVDPPVSTRDPFDVPLDGLTKDEELLFLEGDELFDLPLREADGLGPLFTRTSCGACHAEGGRGPGLVQKMSVVESDGTTPAVDQSKLPFGHTIHPLVAGGGKTPVVAPTGDPTVKVSTRVGPPVLGRGYMEAIADEEIERVAREQAARTDGIHGRINRVVYASERNPDTSVHGHGPGDVVIGRFGLKARIGYLDDFTADALQGDMGITSPLRPLEITNPDGLLDDAKPGVDLSIASVNKRAQYLRLIAIPRRGKDKRGEGLFEQVLCAACHVPAMQTSAAYPIRVLAGVSAPVYSDLLLHDMGDELADGTGGTDGQATSREWRTAPLIGLRFLKNYLHDSRAHSLDESIRLHAGRGSQASPSVAAYLALPDADRQALLDFVSAL